MRGCDSFSVAEQMGEMIRNEILIKHKGEKFYLRMSRTEVGNI